MRKIGIFVTVAILLVMCVIPASAASIPAIPERGAKTMPLHFDGVYTGHRLAPDVCSPWLFNYANGEGQESRQDEDGLGGDLFVSGTKFEIEQYFPGNNVTFYSTTAQIVEVSKLETMYLEMSDTFAEAFAGFQVTVKGSYYYTETLFNSDNSVASTLLRTDGFEQTSMWHNGQCVNLGQMISQLVCRGEEDYIYLRDVSITIELLNYDTVPTNGICAFILGAQGHSNGNSSAPDFWWNEQNISIETKYEIVEDNAFGWLIDVVDSVLDFQIIPGISFGMVFWFIIVIGIMLLVFKLIS